MDLETLVGKEVTGNSGRVYHIVDLSDFHKAHTKEEVYNQRRLCSFHALSAGDKFFVKKMKKGSTEIMFFEHMKARNALDPSIVTLVDIVDSDDGTLLVFPFVEFDDKICGEGFNSVTIGDYALSLKKMSMEGDDLKGYYRYAFVFAYFIIKQLLHIHRQDVLYGDLKPQNILVKECEGKVLFRFCDFEGVYFGERNAKGVLCAERKKEGTVRATLYYSPPELLYEKEITEKWDVYSYGCTMYMLYTHNRPRFIKEELFSGGVIIHTKEERMERKKRYVCIEDCERAGFLTPYDAIGNSNIPWYMRSIIADCLIPDPNTRPSSQEIEKRIMRIAKASYYTEKLESWVLKNSFRTLVALEPYLHPLKLFMS